MYNEGVLVNDLQVHDIHGCFAVLCLLSDLVVLGLSTVPHDLKAKFIHSFIHSNKYLSTYYVKGIFLFKKTYKGLHTNKAHDDEG